MNWGGAEVMTTGIKCAVHEMYLNHPETSPPTPSANCLPRNRSLVPKRLGPAGLQHICSLHSNPLISGFPGAGLLWSLSLTGPPQALEHSRCSTNICREASSHVEVAGPLGTPLGLAPRKRASPRGTRVATRVSWSPLSGLKGVQPPLPFPRANPRGRLRSPS